MQQSFIIFCSILFILIFILLFSYLKGQTDKENEILANSRKKKNKYKRIDDIEEVKERIGKGEL